jgi:hypothetical protein
MRTYQDTKEICTTALKHTDLMEVRKILDGVGTDPSAVAEMVKNTAHFGWKAETWEPLQRECEKRGIGVDSCALQRYVLLQTGVRYLDSVARLPVVNSVKQLIYDEFQFVAQPQPELLPLFAPMGRTFRVMCKILLLERFPAGQQHIEVSGVPRSWLFQVPKRDLPATLRYILFELKGFKPLFTSHTAVRRDLAGALLESEARQSQYRVARTLELQPQIGGYFGGSWFEDPDLPRFSPHLKWLLEFAYEAQRYGAFLTYRGYAPEDAGFLIGDARRRRAYQEGKWRPKISLLLWSRESLIRWAADNRDLEKNENLEEPD